LTKRNDLLAAMDCRTPPTAVPIWELEFHAWNAVSGRHLIVGREFEALTAAESERALHANAEILLAACEQLHHAALTVPNGYWEIAPGQPAYLWLPPDARRRQVEILAAEKPADLTLAAVTGGIIGMPGASQYVEFSYKLFDAPEEIDEMARRALAGGLETARRMRDLGVEMMVSASDLADNRGAFYNPRQMDRFVWPYLRQWAEAVRAMDAFAVLHSDGDMTELLDGLADSPLHAWQAVDPTAGMDMRAAKDRVAGRLCLAGNVDCGLLLTGAPEAVFDATRDLLTACKPGGGLILGASNAVQPEVPMENYRAMIAAWDAFGGY